MVGLRLLNPTAEPVSETFFNLLPAGTVTPPIAGTDPDGQPIEGSPVSALDSSEGVSIDDSFVLLSDEIDPDGIVRERLFLLFGFEPNPTAGPDELPFRPLVDDAGNRVGLLEPGGFFDFEISLADASDAGLLEPGTDGLSLSVIDLTMPGDDGGDDNDGGGGDPAAPPPDDSGAPGAQVPEPSAALLWASLAAAGLGLAHRRRSRSQQK